MSSLNIGDLNGVLVDLVSIDQYQSKLSDDNIVVSFTVKFLEASNDLREFVDRGDFGVLDSETILTSDLSNNYQLLLEFNRDKKFLHYILKLTKYLIKMSDVSKFKFVSFLSNDYVTLNKTNILKLIRLNKIDKKELDTKKMLFNFFNQNIKFNGNLIIVPGYNEKLLLRYKGKTTEELIESFVKVNNIDLLAQEKTPIFLGDTFHPIVMGKYIAIKNQDLDVILMFEQIIED